MVLCRRYNKTVLQSLANLDSARYITDQRQERQTGKNQAKERKEGHLRGFYRPRSPLGPHVSLPTSLGLQLPTAALSMPSSPTVAADTLIFPLSTTTSGRRRRRRRRRSTDNTRNTLVGLPMYFEIVPETFPFHFTHPRMAQPSQFSPSHFCAHWFTVEVVLKTEALEESVQLELQDCTDSQPSESYRRLSLWQRDLSKLKKESQRSHVSFACLGIVS